MPPLVSQVDPGSARFAENRAQMLALLDEVRGLEAAVRAQGERARKKFDARGQLLPRERVARLLDPGAPFLELSTLAGLGMHDDDGGRGAMGGGNIAGIGLVSGVRCLVTASDAAIKGGSVTPMGLKKSLRAQEIALKQRLPSVSLIESGGANLLYQAEIFVDGGRIFANMARLGAAGLPQITVVHGSSTAGGAYMPGLSDYVVMVKGRAQVFLAGPPLVMAALGEQADEEELGGAQMHATVAGTAEYLAEDDAHGLALAREIVGALGWSGAAAPPAAAPRPPRFDPDELCGVVPVDARQPYDVREVIARIVDDSDFLEFKAGYGPETVCGHARIEGRPVGLLGNNGPIFPQGSVKAAQFIQLCEQAGLPLVFLMNTTGYMVGREAEQAGAVKHGSKMIQAVANATVPRITLVLGGAYGAGNYGMCGRGYDPDFIFSWPTAKVAVMGGEQAAMVMKIITRARFARDGLELDEEVLDGMPPAPPAPHLLRPRPRLTRSPHVRARAPHLPPR
jgi:geranyl-CoA carboxylase beta subunit